MNESKSPDSVVAPISARAETEHVDSLHIDRISAALLRARARQRKIFVVAGFALLVALFITLGFIGFSNATAIDVQPDDARDIATFSMVDGLGMTIGNAVYSLNVNPTVEVSATGFRSMRKTIRSSEIGRTVTVELSELPGLLSIKTEPDSEKTRWFIDGQMVVIAELLQHDLFAGEHVVEIDSPYYKKKKISVMMQRGKTLKLAINLEEITGLLNIRTTPGGADIQINGDLVGQSPLALKRGGGSYRIEVVHGDFQPITENVVITNAETVIERDYRLALKNATLHITVSPAGGKLLLNGKVVQPGSLALKAGVDHSLIYRKAGYFSQRRTISLAAGVEQNASFNLKAEFGKVGFYSTPNATVRLDGRDVGQTPLVLTLPALPHRLELYKKGYRSIKQTVTPSSKSAQQIRVRLLTKQQARLAEAPKRYKNSAGIELKQFRPGGVFVMGAPRHEKGQRANEFLRTVKLTMPFYVATHEVSRAQYRLFRQVQGAGNEPVTSISWIDAALYCNWLSRKEKLTPFYNIRAGQLYGSNISSDGYRLPSEAEWEWLARKAGKSKQTRFVWGDATTIPTNSGNIADEFAKGKTSNYVPNYSDGYAGVAPVGSYPPESTGLYDLTGNVSEWVHDVYTLVPPDARTMARDPLGGSQGGTHTVKGSNWRSGRITELRASYREGEKKGRDDIGFRVARYVYGGSNGQ